MVSKSFSLPLPRVSLATPPVLMLPPSVSRFPRFETPSLPLLAISHLSAEFHEADAKESSSFRSRMSGNYPSRLPETR